LDFYVYILLRILSRMQKVKSNSTMTNKNFVLHVRLTYASTDEDANVFQRTDQQLIHLLANFSVV
jgi:hypothetical protein